MNFWRLATNIFAVFSLFFASQISIKAQTENASNAYELPAGTRIGLRMDNEINSRVGSADDTFTATVAETIVIREVPVLPVGAVVEGRILKVKNASAGNRNGNFLVSFDTIRFANGVKRQIEAVLVKMPEPATDSTVKLKAVTIITAAALGGVIGAISKAQNGVLIGTGIGAGAGTGLALLQKGRNVAIKAEEKFEIELVKSVSLPARDY